MNQMNYPNMLISNQFSGHPTGLASELYNFPTAQTGGNSLYSSPPLPHTGHSITTGNNFNTRPPFNPEEDTFLCQTVLDIGEENWGQVALKIHGRTPYECWHRWNEVKVKFFKDILSTDDKYKERVFKLASFSSLHRVPNVQQLCCITNCKNEVKNRSRFSLRSQHKFKEDYMKKSWNKICTKHYFADLYKFKKRTRGKK